MYDTILVGTDGSPSANTAITHALDLAENYDATLHVITVVDTNLFDETALSSSELATDAQEDHANELLDEVGRRASELGVEFVKRCCHGDPHEEIIEYADEIDSDVILLGHQGLSHRSANVIGSTADRVAQKSGRPVFIV